MLVLRPEVSLPGYFDLAERTEVSAHLLSLDRHPNEFAVSLVLPATSTSSPAMIELAGSTDPAGGFRRFDADSIEAPELVYVPGARYTFVAEVIEDSLSPGVGATIDAPASISSASLNREPHTEPLSPDRPDVIPHQKNEDLTFRWRPDIGEHECVTVFRANPSAPERPEIVFDFPQRDGATSLSGLTRNGTTRLTVPGSVFSEDRVYAVVLTILRAARGRDGTTVTLVLAGSGTATILAVGEHSL